MSRYFTALIFLFFVFIPAFTSGAQEAKVTGFTTPAKHLVIIDFDTGEILFEKNARTPMHPASMTKIMTADIVFSKLKDGSLSMDDEFVVSENAWRKGGAKSGSSTMFLDVNSKVKVEDLIKGVIVQSGNDACIVLAEGIAGSESDFAQMMNEQAKNMGLDSANFVNSTGWPDDNHVISAYDLARLAAHTIREFPEFYKLYSLRSFKWNGISQPNRNPLFGSGIDGVDGLKTGHTNVSKYGFVGSGVKDGKRRIFVINGLESRAERRKEARRIMRAAFSRFKVYNIAKKGDKIGSAKVFMGKSETVPLLAESDINIGLFKPDRAKMKVQIKYLSPIPAPIAKGDKIAKLVITAPNKPAREIDLLAGENIEKKPLFSRLLAAIVSKIRGE